MVHLYYCLVTAERALCLQPSFLLSLPPFFLLGYSCTVLLRVLPLSSLHCLVTAERALCLQPSFLLSLPPFFLLGYSCTVLLRVLPLSSLHCLVTAERALCLQPSFLLSLPPFFLLGYSCSLLPLSIITLFSYSCKSPLFTTFLPPLPPFLPPPLFYYCFRL